MAIAKWVFRKADSVFLRGGFYDPPFDAATEGVASFEDADQPDHVTDRYDATLGKRPATSEELAAAASDRLDAESALAIDAQKAIKAAVITGLWGRLGRQPTGPELAAERTRFLAVYRSL